MRGGEVDAITPTFGSNLLPLKGQSGITFNQIPGYYFEHLEFREGKGTSNPLLRAPWMRQAIVAGHRPRSRSSRRSTATSPATRSR